MRKYFIIEKDPPVPFASGSIYLEERGQVYFFGGREFSYLLTSAASVLELHNLVKSGKAREVPLSELVLMDLGDRGVGSAS